MELTYNNQLSDVTFAAALGLGKQRSLSVDVYAAFGYKNTRALFNGSYTLGGGFLLSASLLNFSMDTVRNIYEAFNDDVPPLPPFDVSIESATITISSDKGLEIVLKNVNVAGYTAVSASLLLSPTQVVISGKLERPVKFTVDETVAVEVRQAVLQVKLASTLEGKLADVTIGGELSIERLNLKVAAHLYPARKDSSNKSSRRFEWTIVAALATKDDTLALSKIVPGVKDTFLDLALTEVIFVVASRDDPSLGGLITSGYTFHQGERPGIRPDAF